MSRTENRPAEPDTAQSPIRFGPATVRTALAVAGAYLLVASVYIVVSSRLAATVATDIGELRRVETLKGIIFVIVTATAVFAAALVALRRSARDTFALAQQGEALVANERRALTGMMAASIAHDSNNVLSALLCELEMMPGPPPEQAESYERTRMSVNQLIDLNKRLLSAARQTTATDFRDTDFREAVNQTIHTIRAHRSLRQCEIRVVGGEDSGRVLTSAILVHQIVSNLVVNAGEATDAHGVIEVRLAGDEHRVTLEVHDNGPGVPRERRAQLFSALRTTKREGTGLGLFSARACAHAVGGTIDVGDSPLGGARFTATLPRTPKSAGGGAN